FPKAITAYPEAVKFHLFPHHSSQPHELQGGEQKTHVFYIAFDRDGVTDEPLAWVRAPLVPHASPEWYSASGAIPYLTPKSADPSPDYLRLVDAATEGDDTSEPKRE